MPASVGASTAAHGCSGRVAQNWRAWARPPDVTPVPRSQSSRACRKSRRARAQRAGPGVAQPRCLHVQRLLRLVVFAAARCGR